MDAFTKSFVGACEIQVLEGIDFDHIPYFDNTTVLKLLDNAAPTARGIFQLIDEETKLPNTSDETLLSKMNAAYGKSSDKENPYFTDFRAPTVFTIKHYAGAVVYTVADLLEKSTEILSLELTNATRGSGAPVISEIFEVDSSRHSGAGATSTSSRKPSVGAKFAKQLQSLVELIESTRSHFVRCIKPNSVRSAEEFDAELTLEQLHYSGVFEAVAIRKCGRAHSPSKPFKRRGMRPPAPPLTNASR
jgi:myosin heavy subunit